jgi:hypothetical protein
MPPRVFFEKSLQAVESKGRECEKERKEISRGGKLLKTWNLPQRHRSTETAKAWTGNAEGVTPP